MIGSNLPSPPCNIGPRSTPNYAALAQAAVHTLPTGETVFAGQRNDAFFVDLGAIFDLGDLRPFQNLHLIPSAAAVSVDPLAQLNVHTIAIQIPIAQLTRDGKVPTDATKLEVGARHLGWREPPVRPAAQRLPRVRVRHRRHHHNGKRQVGPWTQVSRLGNPLFNEVVVPLGKKDLWNATQPSLDAQFAQYVKQPELRTAAARAVPGRVPEPGRSDRRPRRPRRDPADGNPVGRRAGLPELHRQHARRHAAAERGDPAGGVAEPARD